MKTPDPLHGVTLETILTRLVDHYGWDELGRAIEIRCFNFDPSVKSSLAFLRKTPWARKKVEDLYVGIAAKWNDGAATHLRQGYGGQASAGPTAEVSAPEV